MRCSKLVVIGLQPVSLPSKVFARRLGILNSKRVSKLRSIGAMESQSFSQGVRDPEALAVDVGLQDTAFQEPPSEMFEITYQRRVTSAASDVLLSCNTHSTQQTCLFFPAGTRYNWQKNTSKYIPPAGTDRYLFRRSKTGGHVAYSECRSSQSFDSQPLTPPSRSHLGVRSGG